MVGVDPERVNFRLGTDNGPVSQKAAINDEYELDLESRNDKTKRTR